MTKTSKVFVDTNILIRALTTNAPLHKEANALIKQYQEQASELWISRQVLREYIVQSTRPQTYQSALPVEQLLKRVEAIEALFKIADDTVEVTAHLLALLKDYPTGGKQVHDANIVATMLTNDIGILLTHNVDDFRRFKSIISIIPLGKVVP